MLKGVILRILKENVDVAELVHPHLFLFCKYFTLATRLHHQCWFSVQH